MKPGAVHPNRDPPYLGNNILDSVGLLEDTSAQAPLEISSYLADALIWSFPPAIEPEHRFILTLTGYFDASGTHRQSETVAVAGFFAAAAAWVEFSARWQLALSDFGLDHFHMTDFAFGAPPYDEWSEPQRRARLARLLTIIREHAGFSVGIVVDRSAFDRIISPRARKVCGDAFGLATIAAFMEVGRMLRGTDIDAWASYVFDRGSLGAGTVLKVFQANMEDPVAKEQLRALDLRFADKNLFLPLQAADILAYELYKDMPRHLRRESKVPRFPLTELASMTHSWVGLNDENLRGFSKVLSVRGAMEDVGELEPL